MKQIPNILSAFRLLLIGVFVYLFTKSEYLFCMLVYIFAFATDILDGYLARRNGWITNVGKVLDPLADKLMLIAVLVCFYVAEIIPLYILLIMLIKDLIMIIVGSVLYFKKVVVYADWFGKIATGLFLLATVSTFANLIWGVVDFYIYIYIVAIAVAVVSFVHYGIRTFFCNKKETK